MQVELLRMVSNGFVNWLRTQVQPAGQPVLYDLEADLNRVINAMPNDVDAGAASLNEQTVRNAVDWLMRAYVTTYPEKKNAVLAAHALRIISERHAAEILQFMVRMPDVPASASSC